MGFVPFRASTAIAEGRLTHSMLHGPAWRNLLPDVYVHAEAPLDHRLWCDAVALRLPEGAAIAGLSAACLWGVDLLPPDAPVEVAMPPDRRIRPHPRITVIRSPLPVDDVVGFGGVSVTTPVRTAFDLGRRPPRVDAVVAVDALPHSRLVRLAVLEAYAREHTRWPGGPLLREVCALAEPLTESRMETRLRLVIVDGGLPRPVAQHDIVGARGRVMARSDLAYPDAKVAIEYEGDTTASGRPSSATSPATTPCGRWAGWSCASPQRTSAQSGPRRRSGDGCSARTRPRLERYGC